MQGELLLVAEWMISKGIVEHTDKSLLLSDAEDSEWGTNELSAGIRQSVGSVFLVLQPLKLGGGEIADTMGFCDGRFFV